MAESSGGLSDATVFVSLALFGVWMYRQKVKTLSGSPSRWGAFFGALSGKYTIVNNVSSGAAAATSTTTTTPSTANPTVSGAGGVTVPGVNLGG